MFRGGYAGPDGGQGWCYGVSVGVSAVGIIGFGSGYHHAWGVSFRNNWADYCYTGIFITNSAYDATFNQIPLRDIVVENNLMTHLGAFPQLSMWPLTSTVQRYSLKQSTGIQGLRFVNNTFRGTAEFGFNIFQSAYQPADFKDSQFDNNIIPFVDYSVFLASSLSDCTPAGMFKYFPNDINVKRYRNNLFFGGETGFLANSNCSSTIAERTVFVADEKAVGFLSESDSRLKDTSPYSAANNKPKTLANDGSSIGADIDLIEQYAIPAMKGVAAAPALMGLEVMVGSRQAVLRYQRPEGAASCQVTLYSGPRMSKALLSDTASEANQKDDRSSSVVQGRQVQFLAGGITPLTPGRAYNYQIQCGATRVIERLGPLNESSEQPMLKRQFDSATAKQVRIEYASLPSLANPVVGVTVGFSGKKALVNQPLPKGYHYWRAVYLGAQGETVQVGPVEIFVSR